MKRKQYFIIDLLKYIFSIGIVALHTPVLSVFGEYEYFVEKAIVRLGVPFFFVASGFLLGSKLQKVDDNDLPAHKEIFMNYTKRLLKPLIFFEILAIILKLHVYFKESILLGCIRIIRSIIFYPGGKLWYIWACIVGVWIIYFIKKIKCGKWILFIGGGLYLFALINNSYYFVVENTFLVKIVQLNITVTSSARNGLFVGFFFLTIGIFCFKIHNKLVNIKKSRAIVGSMCIILYIMYFGEITILQEKPFLDDGSLFIILPIFSMSLVLWASTFTGECEGLILYRNLSTGIYLLHDPILVTLTYICTLLSIEQNAVIKFVITLVIVHAICILFYKKDNKFSKLLR